MMISLHVSFHSIIFIILSSSCSVGLPCNVPTQKIGTAKGHQRSKCRKRKRSSSVSDESSEEEWQPWKEERERRRRSTRKTGRRREGEGLKKRWRAETCQRGREEERGTERAGGREGEREGRRERD